MTCSEASEMTAGFAGMSDEARADTELQMSDRAEWERLGEQQRR